MRTKRVTQITNLDDAYKGSYYTVEGAGGDLNEWIDGIEELLAKEGIGKPTHWFTTNGRAVNEYAEPENWRDAYKDDLTFLMFPLDGLDISRLAIFKLQMQDRWFDDIVDNMNDHHNHHH